MVTETTSPVAHASNVLPRTTLGPHASRVLPSAMNNAARTNKARQSPRPMFRPPSSLSRDLTLKRQDLTAVSPLHNSGLSPDSAGSLALSSAQDPILKLHDLTSVSPVFITGRPANGTLTPAHPFSWEPGQPSASLNRDDLTALSRLFNNRRKSSRAAKSSAKQPKVNTGKAPEFHNDKSGNISMNSMRTHVEIGGAAPRDPSQSERGHSGHPNGARPQVSTEKPENNRAGGAKSAKPTHKGNGALASGYPCAFKPGKHIAGRQCVIKRRKHAAVKSVKNSGNSGGIHGPDNGFRAVNPTALS
jgi:hypothetical protein